jgi:cell division protein FtsA
LETEKYAAGIDIGTTKICTVVGRYTDAAELDILGVGVAPAHGLKSGIVVDRQDAVASISRSVEEAQKIAELPIEAAYIGITGDHIRSTNVVGRVHTGISGEVTTADVELAKQSASDSVPVPFGREIIHAIVRDFSVDGTAGVSRPVGMSGRRLDVLLHIVTGMSTVLANVHECVQAAGISVQAHVLEPIATARAVLTDAERDLGVVILDIGGGTTDVAIFVNGSICHTAALPIAGNRITRDIAQVLRVRQEDAEMLKCRFGTTVPDLVPEDDLVQVTKADGIAEGRVPRRLIAQIIEARLTEIFTTARDEIARAPIPNVGGMVLSGGGSQIPAATQLAGTIFEDMALRNGEPRNVTGLSHLVSSPVHATGVGLAMMAADDGASAVIEEPPSAHPTETVRSWISDLWDRILQHAPW